MTYLSDVSTPKLVNKDRAMQLLYKQPALKKLSIELCGQKVWSQHDFYRFCNRLIEIPDDNLAILNSWAVHCDETGKLALAGFMLNKLCITTILNDWDKTMKNNNEDNNKVKLDQLFKIDLYGLLQNLQERLWTKEMFDQFCEKLMLMTDQEVIALNSWVHRQSRPYDLVDVAFKLLNFIGDDVLLTLNNSDLNNQILKSDVSENKKIELVNAQSISHDTIMNNSIINDNTANERIVNNNMMNERKVENNINSQLQHLFQENSELDYLLQNLLEQKLWTQKEWVPFCDKLQLMPESELIALNKWAHYQNEHGTLPDTAKQLANINIENTFTNWFISLKPGKEKPNNSIEDNNIVLKKVAPIETVDHFAEKVAPVFPEKEDNYLDVASLMSVDSEQKLSKAHHIEIGDNKPTPIINDDNYAFKLMEDRDETDSSNLLKDSQKEVIESFDAHQMTAEQELKLKLEPLLTQQIKENHVAESDPKPELERQLQQKLEMVPASESNSETKLVKPELTTAEVHSETKFELKPELTTAEVYSETKFELKPELTTPEVYSETKLELKPELTTPEVYSETKLELKPELTTPEVYSETKLELKPEITTPEVYSETKFELKPESVLKLESEPNLDLESMSLHDIEPSLLEIKKEDFGSSIQNDHSVIDAQDNPNHSPYAIESDNIINMESINQPERTQEAPPRVTIVEKPKEIFDTLDGHLLPSHRRFLKMLVAKPIWEKWELDKQAAVFKFTLAGHALTAAEAQAPQSFISPSLLALVWNVNQWSYNNSESWLVYETEDSFTIDVDLWNEKLKSLL